MKSLEKRPLGTFASAFYVFACIAVYQGAGVRLCVLLLLFCLFAYILFGRTNVPYRRAFTAAVAGMLAATLLCGFYVDVKLARAEALDGTYGELCGRITDVGYTSQWMGSYTVDAGEMKVELTAEDGELRKGDVIFARVLYEKPDVKDDLWLMKFADGIAVSAEADGVVTVTDRSFLSVIERLSDGLSAKLRTYMPTGAGDFAAALVLGDKSELPHRISRDFRTLGISHILALSGAHLAVICTFVTGFVPKKRKLLYCGMLTSAVVFYMFVTGFSPSVVRAGLMLVMASLGGLVNKRSDSFTSLSVAVGLMCLFDPATVFDVGLQFSYTCVLGISVSLKILRKTGVNGTAGRILNFVLPAVIVPPFTLVLSMIRFGEISSVTVISNIIFVPVITVLIPVLLVLLLLSPFEVLFSAGAGTVGAMLDGILSAVSRAASVTDPVIPLIGTATTVSVILFGIALVSAILICGKIRRMAISLSIILACAVLVSSQIYVNGYNADGVICVASVGEGTSVCAVSHGCSVIIDNGEYPSSAHDAAELGRLHGTGRIDGLIVADPGRIHGYSLPYICENYYVGCVWLPASCDEEKRDVISEVRSAVEKMGVKVCTYIPGEILSVGDIEMKCPSTDEDLGELFFSFVSGDSTVRCRSYSVGRKKCSAISVDGTDIVSVRGAVGGGIVADDMLVTDRAVIRFGRDSTHLVTAQ